MFRAPCKPVLVNQIVNSFAYKKTETHRMGLVSVFSRWLVENR